MHGLVDLGQRAGGDGFSLEAGEQSLEGAVQFAFDRLDSQGAGEGGDVLLEIGQFLDQVLGDQVGAGAEDLSELDEGRSQVLEGHADPLGGGQTGGEVLLFFCGGSAAVPS